MWWLYSIHHACVCVCPHNSHTHASVLEPLIEYCVQPSNVRALRRYRFAPQTTAKCHFISLDFDFWCWIKCVCASNANGTSALDGSVDCASQQVELSFLGGSIVDYAAAWRSDVVAVIACYFTFVRFDFHFHLIRSFTYLDQSTVPQNPFGTRWRETGRTCIFPTVFSHHWIGIIYWKRSLSFTLWQIYWNKCADTIILCSSATANTVSMTLSSTFHPFSLFLRIFLYHSLTLPFPNCRPVVAFVFVYSFYQWVKAWINKHGDDITIVQNQQSKPMF